MPTALITLLWLLAAPVARGALPGAPEVVVLTADETATLSAEGFVARVEDTELGARTTALVEVAAPPSAVLDAVLDFAPRVAEIGSLKAASVYFHDPRATPEQLKAQFVLSIMGRTVTFHTHYVIDRAGGWCSYVLDPERENDLAYVDGAYRAVPTEGGTRLEYRSTTQAGVSVPLWVRRWLVTGSLKDQLMGIKSRAERARATPHL